MDTAAQPPPPNATGKTKRLVLFTFFAVSLSILAAGLVIVPVVIKKAEERYLELQADVNARQSRALVKFAEKRRAEGVPVTEIQKELQTLLTGAEADRGYSCVIDRNNAVFICHPMAMALGMPIASKEADFQNLATTVNSDERVPWETAVTEGILGSGSLFYSNGSSEIIHMESVPETNWTITTHENKARVLEELAGFRKAMLLGAALIGLLLAIPSSLAARAVGRKHEKRIEAEQQRSERLLLNILPQPIAERLKNDESVIADRHEDVTVLFADIVGFTPWAARVSAEELVKSLNQIFSEFDDICVKHGLEKIKTIGDAYMLCGGLRGDTSEAAKAVVAAGLEMAETTTKLATENEIEGLTIRIGVHSGELVAGVIGKRKFSYDLWGDAVNTASRLESSGIAGEMQISERTLALLGDRFPVRERGLIELKGKGSQPVWLVGEGPATNGARQR